MNPQVSTEEEAIKVLVQIREQQGITCPKCKKVTPHRYNEKRKSWFCYCNRSETGLKARSLLHKSKLPIRIYLNILRIIWECPGEFSIKKIQNNIGHKYYPPIWRFFHKVGNILSLAQQADYKMSPEAAALLEEIELVAQYLGVKEKKSETDNAPENQKEKRKRVDQDNREMPVRVAAMARVNQDNEIDPNTCCYRIDKLPETWTGLSKETIEEYLQANTKCPDELKELIISKLNDNASSAPDEPLSPKNIDNDQSSPLKKHVNALFERIKKVHRRVDGDYLSSFMAHHSLKDRRKHGIRGANFIGYLLTNSFSRCWYDHDDFVPPILSRMGYLKFS